MKPQIVRVISGGQSGVDQAALRAAKKLGIKTGGWACRGWRTLDGPAPWLAARFGLRECAQPGYPPRTRANVEMGDATLRIALDFSSRGEVCTHKYIRLAGKPHFNVRLVRVPNCKNPEVLVPVHPRIVGMTREWLEELGEITLNVAGNSEQTARGIGKWAEEFLLEVLA